MEGGKDNPPVDSPATECGAGSVYARLFVSRESFEFSKYPSSRFSPDCNLVRRR